MGVSSGLFVGGAHRMHNVSCLSGNVHVHLNRQHVHGSSHEGMVLPGVWSLI